MKKNLFALFASLMLVAAFSASAQNVKVSGTVSDSNGPLAGAVVMVKGTTNGAATDLDGKYTITADAQAILEVSCLGYKTVEEAVNGRSVINVTLAEDSEILADAVVLGYGVATKKKDLSAAVGVVASPEQLATHPVTSTEALLQGQLPGVTVTANGGSPTATPGIVIRGQGSLNGDGVLWVVDGVPGAPINSLSDIESIVVLKDAASAAIYGATSGAGGVIIVTTKKAQKGVSVSYDGLVGLRNATNVVESLNAPEQIEMRQRSYSAAGQTLPDGWNTAVNPYIGETRTDWLKEIFRTAVYHRHNVVLNAGGENAKNRISFKSDNNDGVLYGTYNKSIGINYKGDFQINKWLKITEDLTWSQGDSRGTDTDSGYSGTIWRALAMPQSASRYFWDGTGYGGTASEDPEYLAKYGNFSGIHGDVVNPFRGLTSSTHYSRSNNLFTTTGLEIANIVKGLRFQSRFSYYINNGISKDFSPMITEVGKPELGNSLSENAYRNDGWKTENSLIYDRTFGKHSFGALLSTTADYAQQRGFNANGATFADEEESFQFMQYAATTKATDYFNGPDANVAIISRISYSYADRYFVTASYRRDIAGRLPNDHNYGDFPAVTGAWKISSEPFFPKTDVVNLLKLRASWGRIGNLGSIGWNYKSNLLSSTSWDSQSMWYGIPEVADGNNGGIKTGKFYYLGSALNPFLTWETSDQLDFGLDLNMFKDRLSFSFDVYNKRTYNLIQNQSTGWPSTIGISAMKINQGEVKNRGFEMVLGWADKVGDFNYYVNGNVSYNKNWVADTGIYNEDGTSGVWTGGGGFRNVDYIYQTAVGEPINSYYLINALGIFQNWEDVYDHQKDGKLIQPYAQPGDLKFEDANNDGVIDNKDRQYWGNAAPDYTFALNAGFDWKGLTFSMMLQGVQGAQAAYMAKYTLFSDGDGNFNRGRDILNAWTPDNTTSSIPRLTRNDDNKNFTTPSTWYLEDASYIRLKNVTIGYDFSNVLRKLNHFGERNSSCMLYFSGENLFTLTKYSGMDPECGGWDGLKYPVSRVLSVGVKLTY